MIQELVFQPKDSYDTVMGTSRKTDEVLNAGLSVRDSGFNAMSSQACRRCDPFCVPTMSKYFILVVDSHKFNDTNQKLLPQDESINRWIGDEHAIQELHDQVDVDRKSVV